MKVVRARDVTLHMTETVIGKRIIAVRNMTEEEAADEGWTFGRHGAPTVIVLDDGTRVYASRDPEGNGPGALFGADGESNKFAL